MNLNNLNLKTFDNNKNSNFSCKKIQKKNEKNIFRIAKILYSIGVKKNKKSITRVKLEIGTVVILLSSNFKGKKAVLLKRTESGLYVVSGPYKVNGVFIRRINPRYILPTQIQINIEDINTKIFNDEYFSNLKKSKNILNKNLKKRMTMAHSLRQLFIDRHLQKKIDSDLFLSAYLRSNYIRSSFKN
jgi:large subunit ribosomal protein L6e